MLARQSIRIVQGSIFTVAWLMGAAACGDSGNATSGSTGSGQCIESTCALVPPQCGCDGSDRCVIDDKGTHFCAPSGTGKPSQTCLSGAPDCQAGSLCVGLSSDVHVCAAFCNDDADCGGGLCSRHLSDGNGSTIANVQLCSDLCDPLAPSNVCGTGTVCAIIQESEGQKRWFSECTIPQGSVAEGGSCATDKCAAGLVCAGLAGSNTCHTLCNVANNGCASPQKCIALDPAVTIGAVQYGVCQ